MPQILSQQESMKWRLHIAWTALFRTKSKVSSFFMCYPIILCNSLILNEKIIIY